MAMKKTSGGDSPLRQGAGKSFWTLPISGRRRKRIAMYSGVIGYLGFSRRGVFIGEWASSEVDRGGQTHQYCPYVILCIDVEGLRGGHSLPLGHTALLCGLLVTPLRLLFGSLKASVNFWMFGFCFIQF
jgi:hypothetical protein